MKKILMIALIAAGALGLTMTTASAKCAGDKPTTEKPAPSDGNGTKGKCGQGKCGGK
ncbi:MAG: hypothetical protein U9Q90_00185 [Campylobacterota bacterium]|nr:hypothetical protein [Campylobacterota bacterium]